VRIVARCVQGSIAVGLLLALFACTRQIGDACKSSIDCSQESDRTCDISQPSGYCTIEGCDERSCPSSSACVRFFPRLFIDKTCNLDEVPGVCASDEVCVPAGAGASCAPRTSERRYCVHTCSDNGDCRSGYICRATGAEGTLGLALDPKVVIKFCAPNAP
jgi:hypothetical protein